jgi:hypothetical protein
MRERSLKILQSTGEASKRSKAENANLQFFNFYAKKMRKPFIALDRVYTLNYLNDNNILLKICDKYKLKDIDFGNWTSQNMRYNFTFALLVAMYDLEKVLNFHNNNLGFKKLSIAYGARGRGGAWAHYEPATDFINLSRERRKDKRGISEDTTPEDWAEHFSGFGSLAHEYGHFLDYYFGRKEKGGSAALSGGIRTLPSIDLKKSSLIHKNFYQNKIAEFFIQNILVDKTPLRRAFFELYWHIFFKIDKYGAAQAPSNYYYRLYEYATFAGSYWIRLNEIWARLFEVYINYKLYKKGIVNKLLVKDGKGKYAAENKGRAKSDVYLTYSELEKVLPQIEKIIDLMRKKS